MNYDLTLYNCNTINEDGEVKAGVDISISEGKIKDINNSRGKLDEYYNNHNEVVDCTNFYITPGFVNLHTHSPMNIFRGIAEDVTIDDWFNKEIWPFESKMTREDVYTGALGAIYEMIDCGVTAFADHYFFPEQICEAVIKTGIKGDIAPTIFGMAEGYEEQLKDSIELILRMNGINPRLKIRMGPHSPYTCPGDTLKGIIQRAKVMEVGIHIHVSETLGQVEESIRDYELTPFERLKKAGGLDLPNIIGHGLWITKEDRKLLGKETFMAISPKTYMKLAMGYGHIWEDSFELPLAIGTDGAASSNTINPLEQLRLFGLVGKSISGDSTKYTTKELWKILMAGHRALDFKSGFLKEGYSADLLIWNINRINTIPLYNPLAAIIYSSYPQDIIHTLVDGKFLKRDGKVLGKDGIEEIINQRARSIQIRGKGKTEIRF